MPDARPQTRLIPLLAVGALLTACGARQPAVTTPQTADVPAAVTAPAATPVDIPALIERGCFACLERALAEARRRNAPDAIFEAAALLALRAKELGMPHQEWMEHAAAAAQNDPARTGLLEIIAAMPLDPLSGNRDAVFTGQRVRPASDVLLERLAAAPASPAFRGYLDLSIRCSPGGPPERPETTIAAQLREIPLIRFRLGICGSAHAAHLRAVRDADTEFADVDYALARYAMERRPYPDVDEAIRLLQTAMAAFPRSPAIATTLGQSFQAIEEWPGALRAYDAALALVPDHPDALLGRTIVLSSSEQHLAAIESATRLMEGRWFLGEAYYWRAWNRFQLEEYVPARVDADRMKSLLINSRAYLLSGLIDWRLRRLESAEVEFEQSIVLDGGQCEAATFLGGVRNERNKPREALEAFTFAKRCYELEITVRREALKGLEASDAPQTYKDRERVKHMRFIERAERRRDEAAFGIDLLQKYLTSIQGPQTPRRP